MMTSPIASSKTQRLSRRGYLLGLAAILGAALVGLGIYVAEGARQVNSFGFPLDDSWIHLQIARNLASGQGWSFNPGEPTGAATSPLWVLLITPLFYLGGDVTVWVKVVGSLLYLATVLLVADVASLATGDRRVGLLAGALAALQPALIWTALSGMETGIYLLLFLLSLRSFFLIERHGARAAYASTIWLTLAGYSRPELWALLLVLWGTLLLRRRELSAGRWWVHGGIVLLGLGGFALFNWTLWGHPVPATLLAKRAHLRGPAEGALLAQLRALAVRLIYGVDQTLRSQNVVMVTCLAAGLIAIQRSRGDLARRLFAIGAIVGVGIFVISFLDVGGVPFQTYRRAAYVLACMNMLVAFGFVALYDTLNSNGGEPETSHDAGHVGSWWLQRIRSRRALACMAGLASMALLVQIASVRSWAELYANDVRSINEADVAAGRWLAEHTPPDALIAANDIGAIAYFSRRRIFDMIGLASPEPLDILRQTRVASPERDAGVKDLLVEKQVDYVAVFPTWFPHLVEDPLLYEIQRFKVENPTTLGGEEVILFKVAGEDGE